MNNNDQTKEHLTTRFKQLFEGMSSGVAVYQAVDGGNDFIFKDLNRAGEEIEDVKREDIIGRRVTEVFPGVEEFGLLEVFRSVWKTGSPRKHPVTLYKDQRITGWRENYIYKLPSGEVVAIYDDITERKQAEEGLKAANQQLNASNQQLRATEQQLRTVNIDLGERGKELNYFYRISALIERSEITLEKLLQGAVELIPSSWQYPEITAGRIVLGDQEFKTEDFRETSWKQAANLNVRGKRTGVIEVCYLEERPEHDEGPFLNEERNLIDSIAERLGRIIERKQAEEGLKAANQQLVASNKQLRASEQQLQATNQQLDAGNQQLRANEQQLKATELELRSSKQFLENIFDAIQDGISVLDPELNIIRTNHWMEQMFPDQMPLSGRKCYQVYQQLSSPCSWCPSLPAFETGEIHTAIVPYPSPENPTGWMELTAFPIKDEQGNTINIIEYVKDITKRRQAEKELEKHREQLVELVKERTRDLREKVIELERLNNAMVDREFRIKKLRDQVEKYETQGNNTDRLKED